MMNWQIPVGAAALAFLVGWTINGWRVGQSLERAEAAHARTVAEYQGKLAEGLAEAQRERERLAEKAKEALDERDQEIERLAVAAARVPDTIRVRVPAPCPVSAAGNPVPGDPPGDGAPGGVVPDRVGEGYRELDLRRATELMRRADRVSADLRAVLKACQP